ncbi:MAG: hypothetical protein ACFFAY_03985, partial [Promethearchaeota archaeon]
MRRKIRRATSVMDEMNAMKEVWMVDYARTPFSRSRPNKPETDVFGEIRGDELLSRLLMKFFDGSLANKGIEKKDIDEIT